MKVLANDGIGINGKKKLEANGFEVLEVKVANEQLADYINKNKIEALTGPQCYRNIQENN